jgi:acetyl-CoA carboxylase biotin carboxyl carrier protein
MELKELKSLIKLISETDISEFILEDSEGKIQIKRGVEKELVPMVAPHAAPVAPAAPVPVAAADPEPASDNYEAITAPMVGTFYRRPSPDADMYCNVGDVIEAGQSLGLIEAMKLFNDIDAEFKCRIVEIFKDNAAPVEFGETLFLVERL